MMITGSIYNSLKLMKLDMKWQQRQNNPNMPKGEQEEDPQMKYLRESAESVRKSNVISTIDGKLRAGLELSPEEMNYLRNNNPKLYQEALEIRKERAEYKKKLSACKTKDDVAKLNTEKLQNFAAEVKSIQRNPNLPVAEKRSLIDKVMKKTMGVQNEHARFINSKEYQSLPTEQEIRENKKKEKKHKTENEEQKTDDISPNSKDFYMQLVEMFEQEGIQMGTPASNGEEEGKIYSSEGVITSSNPVSDKSSSLDIKISVKA